MKIFSFATTSHLLPFAFCLCFFCCATISDPPITETTLKNSNNILRETFDPAALRDDLFVIQPTFSRDEIQFTIVDTNQFETTKTKGEILQPINTLIEQESSFTQNIQQVFRVQLLALSNGKNSRKRYKKLTAQLSEPVYIQKRGDLFLISAGNFRRRESAVVFKNDVIKLSSDYSDAFVISIEKPITNDIENNNNPSKKRNNVEQFSTFGWRVLLDQFLVQKQADAVKEKAIIHLRRHDVDVIFKAPWYKVEVGHYTTENAVQIATEKIQRKYPNAIKVRSQIILPESDK